MHPPARPILRARMRHTWLIAETLLLAVLLAGGCVQSKGARPPAELPMASGEDLWSPQPVALRIYPSTRFVIEREVPLLEARIELFDQMGDSIKSSGRGRFELFAADTAPGVAVGRLLYSWDMQFVTQDDQQQYYDPITRGYLLRLRLDSDQITRRPVLLRVTFQPPEGERLVAEAPVRINW